MNRIISWGEVRLALRLLVKQPILSVTIILALATGICVATMGFTFREELLNATLPYAAGDRFARLFGIDRDGNRLDLDVERYHLIRDQAKSFEFVGVGQSRPFNVRHAADDVELIRGAMLSPGTMRYLEAAPVLGRTLIAADGEAGAERVAVIRESLWRRRYSADPSIVGRQITIGAVQHTVVGVMPDTLEFPAIGEMWVAVDEESMSGLATAPGQRAFGVLRPGVAFETASAEINQLAAHLPISNEPGEINRLMVKSYLGDTSNGGDVLSAAMVFVLVMLLMVVASNVATLIFARTWSRAGELAVRTALGAPRTRVVGQLFMETLVLGSIAAVIGLAGAFGILRWLRSDPLLSDMPSWLLLYPTPRTMVFVIALTLLVGVISGLLPALRVTRHDLLNSLHAGRGFAAGGFGRVGAVLLVIEIALSVGLLNGAVTMARAFDAQGTDLPAVPKNQVLVAQLGWVRDPQMRDRIIEAARSLPGVVAAGAGENLPRQQSQPRPTAVEAIGDEPVQAAMTAPSYAVGYQFLETVGGRTIAGRSLTTADFSEGAAPVAVVNEPFVRKFLGGGNPLGRRIRIESPREDGSEEPWREIVGVVPDLGLSVANPSMSAGFYYPDRDQFLWHLAIRTTNDPLKLAPQLRAAAANVDPDAQLEEIRTLDDADLEGRAFLSFVGMGMTAIGAVTLLLSIVGIYALLSFMVTRRTREIGIRIALGATSRQVLRSVTGGAMLYLAIGGVLGSLLGLAVLSMRDYLLISIPDAGLWMPLTIMLTLAVAGAAACWIPARRALAIRPSEALNAD
jgi:putative ABC transport system permease protein